mgnify:FL=1
MTSKVVVIDPSISGVSGDMMLASLIDLGVDAKLFESLRKAIIRNVDGVENIEIVVEDVVRGGIRAKAVDVKISERFDERSGLEMIRYAEAVADEVNLSSEMKKFVVDTMKILVDAESKVHGKTAEDTHLHELGSADTIVDVVGVAMALEFLGLVDATFYSLPVAVGKGYVKTDHGLYPVPAPATLEILRRGEAIFFTGHAEGELTTPTGAAIICSLAKSFVDSIPVMKLTQIGYGAGKKDFGNKPNVVRVLVGNNIDNSNVDGLEHERIVVVETDVDDVSGEVVGYTVERLFEVGAKDVSIVPIYMKKNRPGYSIRVLADEMSYSDIVKTLVRELGTLGVRMYVVNRFKVPHREIRRIAVDIEGSKHLVDVKISKDFNGNIVNIKPEYESVKKIAKDLNKAYRSVANAVLRSLNEIGEG